MKISFEMAMAIAIAVAAISDKMVYRLPGGQDIASGRSSGWMTKYVAKVMDFIHNSHIKQNYLSILLLVAPLIVVLLLSQLLFSWFFGTIGKILFMSVILFYFLGNNKKEKGDNEFVRAHEHGFGILFWFALLGPVGALLYWFLIVNKKDDTIAEPANSHVNVGLMWLHAMAAWIPARITGFVYALVGNFSSGFNCWLGCIRTPTMPSKKVLTDCGQAATDASIESDEKNLVARAFIAWVVLSILIVIYK